MPPPTTTATATATPAAPRRRWTRAEANIVLRALTADDVDDYVALRRVVVADSPLGMGLPIEEELLRPLDGFRGQLSAKAPSAVFGVFEDAKLVATAGLLFPTTAPSGRHKAVLWGVCCLPAARCSGHARALAEHALVHAFAHGARRAYLGVFLPNPRAIALYESLGFAATGRELEVLRLGDAFHDIQYMSLAADAAARPS